MLSRSYLFAVGVVVSAVGLTWAAVPKAPPPPAEYDVLIRYYLEGFRNERIVQFLEMKQFLKDIGFQDDPDEPGDPQDVRVIRIRGTIASASARRILGQRHIQAIRLLPRGAKLDDKEAPVRVHLDLNPGLGTQQQRLLHLQVRQVIASLGFQEGAGYDDRNFTRLVGSIPSGQVDTLAMDLRRLPSSWALLSKSLLSDMRAARGGVELLRKVLDEWYDHPEGKKAIQEVLIRWRLNPGSLPVLRSLPADVLASDSRVDRTTIEVRLLFDLAGNPAATETLQRLLAEVQKSKAAVELMDILFKRSGALMNSLDLPLLFRSPGQIRVVQAFPGMPLPRPRPSAPEVPPGQEKLTPDLREVLADAGEADKRRRLEVIFALPPEETDPSWQRILRQTVRGLDVEGRLGSLVTIFTETKEALTIASLPEVVTVRLPRVARSQVQTDPARARENFQPLQLSGVARLHSIGQRGRGQRVAVIDSDFRGWRSLKGHQLPAETRLIDLTRERNPDLEPDPEPGPADQIGTGTRYALALIKAAPSADLTLIRIDPGAPYQVQTIAQVINGDTLRSLNMTRRLSDLESQRIGLRIRKDQILEERRVILGDFNVDENAVKRREDYFKRQAAFDQEEKKFQERVERYFLLQKELRELKGIRIVASALLWTEGYPVDGSSALSRYFDDRPFKAALWFQAAGNTQGQAWSGLFRDANGNGIMEFAPPTERLPKDSRSPELNFMDWVAPTGETAHELPANARLRITLQWREAHDPEYLRTGDDPYRQPLARFRIVVLSQPDPTGQKQPSDDLEMAFETVGEPQRLEETRNSGTYEHVLQFRVPKAGRYVVRIEGRPPEGIKPPEAPMLQTARKVGEVKPRLFVETLEGPGRAVWHDYATGAGSLGMPADALRVITVGSANSENRRQSYSPAGPVHTRELLSKPDVLAYDQVDDGEGTGLAASFAAGIAAASMNPDTTLAGWMKRLKIEPGQIMRIPETWGKK